jgi:hypothetical protein
MRKLFVPLLLAGFAASSTVAGAQQREFADVHVRVEARIVLLDREEARRVGLSYAQVGGGRILIEGGRRGGVGVGGALTGLPFTAFVDLARERRLVRSDSRMQVLTLSGSGASLASGSVSMSGWGSSRVEGPELEVFPTLLQDGRIQLEVRARSRDEVTDPYGYRADGSPVDVATVVIVRPGEEATIGNVQVVEDTRDAGLLRWRSSSGSRDVLVSLRAEVVEM